MAQNIPESGELSGVETDLPHVSSFITTTGERFYSVR